MIAADTLLSPPGILYCCADKVPSVSTNKNEFGPVRLPALKINVA